MIHAMRVLRWAAPALALTAVFVAFSALAAQPANAPTSEWKEPGALLKAAQNAVAGISTLTYSSTVTSEGPLSAAGGTFTAAIASRRMDAGGWAVRAKGEMTRKAGGESKEPLVRPFEVVYDGVIGRALHDASKEVAETSATDLDDLRLFFMAQDAGKSVAWELLETPAYSEATKEATLALEGTATAGGVTCNILKVIGKSDAGGTLTTRYFLGATDNLPRRIERARIPSGVPEAGGQPPTRQVLTFKDLKPGAPVGPSEFVMGVPDGYTVVPAPGRKAKEAVERPARTGARVAAPERDTGLLAVGAVAPEWSLKGGDGKVHKLSEYRGKVVVMDFWGTWCPWCIKAMPAIQKVHEKYKGKSVVVLGMNYEGLPTADPAGYMEKNQFTYGLILGAEQVAPAYKVSGWPTLYVIGADGKVLFGHGGFSTNLEDELTKVIELGLKDTGL